MKDEWLRAALTDDTVVVELLFRLKQSSSGASTPMMYSKPSKTPAPPQLISWGQRLPRSKPANTLRKDSAAAITTTSSRFSPTTPLSWSDGGYDESSVSRSVSDPSSSSRSKGYICTSEANNTSSVSKRSRKKRKFAQLKEENVLLKERIQLNQELATLEVTLKEQKVRSKNLKQIKFDLNQQSTETGETEAIVSDGCYQMEESTANCAQSLIARHARQDKLAVYSSSRKEQEVETNRRRCFVLPDLNVLPTEEEIAAVVL